VSDDLYLSLALEFSYNIHEPVVPAAFVSIGMFESGKIFCDVYIVLYLGQSVNWTTSTVWKPWDFNVLWGLPTLTHRDHSGVYVSAAFLDIPYDFDTPSPPHEGEMPGPYPMGRPFISGEPLISLTNVSGGIGYRFPILLTNN
jgi:hypothetical protein